MNGIGSGNGRFSNMEMEYIRRHHRQQPGHNQCASALVKHIRAPVPQVAFFLLFFILFIYFYFLFYDFVELNLCVCECV